MNDNTSLEKTDIIDLDEELRKEEELMNTIKMEPILETTVIDEEPVIAKKKKRMRMTDYFLIGLIVVLVIAFVIVLVKVK